MREIKFRAWDLDKKEWLDCDSIISRVIVNPSATGKEFEINESLGNGLAKDLGINIELMQYTGLKDKNLREIYEGDIVKATVNQHIWRYVIETVNGFGNNLYAVTKYRNFETLSNTDEEYVWGDFFVNEGRTEVISLSTYEIIGNIHDNPELLQKPR